MPLDLTDILPYTEDFLTAKDLGRVEQTSKSIYSTGLAFWPVRIVSSSSSAALVTEEEPELTELAYLEHRIKEATNSLDPASGKSEELASLRRAYYLQAKTIFRHWPSLRAAKSDIGRQLQLIDNELRLALEARTDINTTNGLHCLSMRTRQMLLSKTITIEELFDRLPNNDQLRMLSPDQREAYEFGLDLAEITNNWICKTQQLAKITKVKYSTFKLLSPSQQHGLLWGFSLDEVQQPWFDLECLTTLARGTITYNQYARLNQWQQMAMQLDRVNYKEINFPKFSYYHYLLCDTKKIPLRRLSTLSAVQAQAITAEIPESVAMQNGFTEWHILAHRRQIPLSIYQGLTELELKNLLYVRFNLASKGITLAQFLAPSFKPYHFEAAMLGRAYEEYQGLTALQLEALINCDLTRDQVNHSWYEEIHLKLANIFIPYELYQGKPALELTRLWELIKFHGFSTHYTELQQAGLINGLDSDVVRAEWFSEVHLRAATQHLPPSFFIDKSADEVTHMLERLDAFDLANLSEAQITGLLAGLSLEQVQAPWFNDDYAELVRSGSSFEEIQSIHLAAISPLDVTSPTP